MAFDPVERLKRGNCSFLGSLTMYDRETLIQIIRKSSEKDVIINDFLSLVMNEIPHFCFKIIYDNPLFTKETLYLLNKYVGPKYMNTEMFQNFFSSPIAEEYVYTHFTEMVTDDERLDILFTFLFSDYEKHEKFLSFLRLHPDLHIRARFMIFLAKHNFSLLDVFYDDFMKYLTSYTHQEFEQLTFLPPLMDKEDIAILAVTLAQNASTLPLYYKLKEYILKTYPENDLAKELTNIEKIQSHDFDEALNTNLLLEDLDRFFLSSYDQKLHLYKNYVEKLGEEIREQYAKFLTYFDSSQHKDRYSDYSSLYTIYSHGLGKKLEELLERYLSLSHNTSTEFLRCGSTSAAYRIGDFVFKLSHRKWSYEDIICSNLYLIIKNLEEILLRNSQTQRVVAGIEVQKYLQREATKVPSSVFDKWNDALHALGWKTSDTLMGGNCGDNCRMLDSYKDADTNDPEGLPDWFKEYPAVAVDRDLYYRLINYRNRKEIPEGWGDL